MFFLSVWVFFPFLKKRKSAQLSGMLISTCRGSQQKISSTYVFDTILPTYLGLELGAMWDFGHPPQRQFGP